MSISDTVQQLTQLSVHDRLTIVTELWDTIDGRSDDWGITESDWQEWDRRMELADRDLSRMIPANEFWSRVRRPKP